LASSIRAWCRRPGNSRFASRGSFERPAPNPVRVVARADPAGPAYLKLGQFLATRPDVVGVIMARDLESLQDRLPPFSQAEAEAVIAQSWMRPVAQAFASFGPRSPQPRSRRCIAVKRA